jgi:hypothetical protein
MPDELKEAKLAEAAHAAAVAHEANANAREAQMQAGLVAALKEVLTDNSPNGWALLQRVPLICNDIRDIKKDMGWHKWLLLGITTGIGMIALKTLGGV